MQYDVWLRRALLRSMTARRWVEPRPFRQESTLLTVQKSGLGKRHRHLRVLRSQLRQQLLRVRFIRATTVTLNRNARRML
jgi:hypothetical protein